MDRQEKRLTEPYLGDLWISAAERKVKSQSTLIALSCDQRYEVKFELKSIVGGYEGNVLALGLEHPVRTDDIDSEMVVVVFEMANATTLVNETAHAILIDI